MWWDLLRSRGSLSPRGDTMVATELHYDPLSDLRASQSHRRSMVEFFLACGENVSETTRASDIAWVRALSHCSLTSTCAGERTDVQFTKIDG